MTKEQKAIAEHLQQKLAAGGLNAEVGFTRSGYIRLTVDWEEYRKYTCTATLQAKAAEILGNKMTDFYTTIEKKQES